MDQLNLIATIVAVIGTVYALFSYVRELLGLRQQRDTIVRGHAVPTTPEVPQPKPLTPDEKIDALYQLSKRQSRVQFIANFAWAVFGIIGGYLAGRVLPH